MALMTGIRKLCNWAAATTIKALRRKNAKTLAILISCLSIALFVKLRVLCPVDDQDTLQIDNVCQKYKEGEFMGDLCHDLCDIRNIFYKTSCHVLSLTRGPIIEGIWRNNSIVFKMIKTPPFKLYKIGPNNKKIYPTKDQFSHIMEKEIANRYNLTAKVMPSVVEKFWDQSKLKSPSPIAHMHMENAWLLLHSKEFMMSDLYGKYDVFPKVLGTCGPLLAVKKLNSLTEYWHLFALYDTVDQWIDRVKVAVKILDYLADLESKPRESLLICNMKLTEFGLTDDNKRVMYLDLEYVHPQSVANRITSNGSHCRRHSECDYKNCRSFCNLITFKCQHGVVNNNLQIVCEKIFLGWVSSRVMVPGLLIGPHTPRVLSEVLELCANPAGETGTPRAPASHDIGKRLYDLLVQLSYTTK